MELRARTTKLGVKSMFLIIDSAMRVANFEF